MLISSTKLVRVIGEFVGDTPGVTLFRNITSQKNPARKFKTYSFPSFAKQIHFEQFMLQQTESVEIFLRSCRLS